MHRRPYDSVLAVMAFVTTIGCVDSTKVGLSNVRAREWPQERLARTDDVISNGDNSCERPGSRRPDPAPVRLHSCPGIQRETPRVATAK
jgi:hypothetical protein